LKKDLRERLNFLVRVVTKEIRHLEYSTAQVFRIPFTPERAALLTTDQILAEKVEAFVSRFCRLQDTLGDKLLPVWLQCLEEKTGAVIDNLDRAEKLGVLASADKWLEIRQLRNQMIHEYIDSPLILSNAIGEAGRFQTQLISFANALIDDACKRGMIDKPVG